MSELEVALLIATCMWLVRDDFMTKQNPAEGLRVLEFVPSHRERNGTKFKAALKSLQ